MIAIIVAAGSSRRMGFDKLTANLAGKPVVAHSLLAFARTSSVTHVVLVTREERLEEFRALAKQYVGGTRVTVVSGGSERHFSVWEGLCAADPDPSSYVAVHDAARPLIQPREIEACLKLAGKTGAATCAAPVADTLKRVDDAGEITGSVDRTGLWAMQTPQIFRVDILQRAYRQVLESGDLVTDEVSAMEQLGHRVPVYKNEEPNFKITVPHDLDLARLVLAARMG